MTERSEVGIVAVEATGPPVKRNFPFAVSWFTPIRFTLEDGRTIDTFNGAFTRKRDALAGTEKLQKRLADTVANFHDDRFVGTTTTYNLGVR